MVAKPLHTDVDRKVYYPHTLIFREGEPGDCAYLIDKGVVEISILRNGQSAILAQLTEGDLFGEMSLIDDQVRSATARALEKTELVVIDREIVNGKMAKADPLVNLFLRVILQRYRDKMLAPARDAGSYVRERNICTATQAELESERKEIIRQLKVKHELELAIDQDQFELLYQPIVDLSSGTIRGFESLVRWDHPQWGRVPPNDFIDVAEQSGLIVPMGLWILNDACLQLQNFHELLARDRPGIKHDLFVSVNVSARQIAEKSLLRDFSRVLESVEVDRSHIKLEITESLLMEDPQAAEHALTQLKKLGVKIAIDDFGTGYSSLSYLHRFPIDTIKIDRAFVLSMIDNHKSLEIVRTIAGLAHNLDMDVIAEGIETPEAMQLIREFGCDYGQGYLFSKPIPASEAISLLTSMPQMEEAE